MCELTPVKDQAAVLLHIPCGGLVAAWAADHLPAEDVWPDRPSEALSLGVAVAGELPTWCECEREEQNDA